MNVHSRSRRDFLKALGVGLASLTLPDCITARGRNTSRPRDRKPNIILIMADDLGYSDLGCYGGEIETPNLDSLAGGGMRFTQFYNCAKCSPTRASLLTGQYDQAVGVKNLEHGATFAEVLRAVGYRTIAAGKWHQTPLPTTRGFDRYYGLADGCCNYWNPGTRARPGEGKPGRKKSEPRRWAIEDEVIMGYVPEDRDFYTTDAFADYAIERLEEYKNEDKPFLLYLPQTAPHYPLHAWPEDIAKYRGKYKVGWDELRRRRYERQIKMGILDPKYAPSPRDDGVPSWDSLSNLEKDRADLKMAVYAAMVDRMDQAIGRVLAKVKQIGKWENTLVLFLADNGGCAETPDKTPDIPPGPVEGYRALGPAWANASNTPYRKYKSTDYEGGACTPFIAYWPGFVKPGTITDQVGHIIDVLPTFMEIAGASYPRQLDGRKLRPVAGKSLLSVFQGKQRRGHGVLYWQFGKAKAVRIGKWKLVRYGEADWELYDLQKDRTELNDLAARHPRRVREMAAMWEDWWTKCTGKEVKRS
ncbi:MAG: arylsulfatase [Phycisphaerales bacterium]|nr:MAG: arylsulfatase [Phycisphaerales bacterium]